MAEETPEKAIERLTRERDAARAYARRLETMVSTAVQERKTQAERAGRAEALLSLTPLPMWPPRTEGW